VLALKLQRNVIEFAVLLEGLSSSFQKCLQTLGQLGALDSKFPRSQISKFGQLCYFGLEIPHKSFGQWGVIFYQILYQIHCCICCLIQTIISEQNQRSENLDLFFAFPITLGVVNASQTFLGAQRQQQSEDVCELRECLGGVRFYFLFGVRNKLLRVMVAIDVVLQALADQHFVGSAQISLRRKLVNVFDELSQKPFVFVRRHHLNFGKVAQQELVGKDILFVGFSDVRTISFNQGVEDVLRALVDLQFEVHQERLHFVLSALLYHFEDRIRNLPQFPLHKRVGFENEQ